MSAWIEYLKLDIGMIFIDALTQLSRGSSKDDVARAVINKKYAISWWFAND